MRLGIGVVVGLLLAGPGSVSAQWQTIEPGGATLCADGSPFRFFVHPGDPARLVVEFEGGGACWSADTCSSFIYSRNIQSDPETARAQGLLQGFYDRDNPANPIREWTHVYVPYCTGDLHWGQGDQTYVGATGPFVIHHRGALNARAAVEWTFDHVGSPAQLFVTGCSAGGYGSIMWAPWLISHYPGAASAHLADSAAGVVPAGFLGTLRQSWGVSAVWPSFIPALPLDRLDTTLVDFYAGVAGYYPGAAFSQFNREQDATQVFFASLAAGALLAPEEWQASMEGARTAIEASSPNFHSYTAPGIDHCVINQAAFYTTDVQGVRLSDWVAQLLATGAPGRIR